MKWKDSLTKWRNERNITEPQGAYFLSIEEELREYEDAVATGDESEIIDALADIMVFTANEVALMGYDLDLVMKQVVKHIMARRQDPEQAKDWAINGPSGKWNKDINQDPSTIPSPNYSVCKLGGV